MGNWYGGKIVIPLQGFICICVFNTPFSKLVISKNPYPYTASMYILFDAVILSYSETFPNPIVDLDAIYYDNSLIAL